MNFIVILRSLEEFLYEVMTWIVFYPRTLFRTVVKPTAMARYTKLQLEQEKEQQFTEMISPVLMLILSVLLAHGLEMAASIPIQFGSSPLASLLFGTEQGLLATRSVVFSLYALIAALIVMTRVRTPVNRETLREPFFIECYLVSPFVILLSTSLILARVSAPWVSRTGALLTWVAIVWYIGAQSSVYRHLLGLKALRSIFLALAGFVVVTVFLAVTFVILLGLTSQISQAMDSAD